MYAHELMRIKPREHFKRKHRLLLHCPRCWVAFKLLPDFNAHMAAPDGCQPGVAPDGVTDYQWVQIHDKHNFVSVHTEEDKWRVIYRILWPDDNDIPPPCMFTPFLA
jgi:hypothetical protein